MDETGVSSTFVTVFELPPKAAYVPAPTPPPMRAAVQATANAAAFEFRDLIGTLVSPFECLSLSDHHATTAP